jgi:LysR family transcriptional regulator, regulator of abg operon
MPTMKLKQLTVLQAVHETGSLLAAAEQLNVTQPGVSRAIIELESELGVTLLVRSARGATLTEFGRSVLARAQLIDREVRRIVEDAEATRGVFNGRLTIAITPPAATSDFAETITAFADAHPDVQLRVLELRSHQITSGLRDGMIDVALFAQYGKQESSPHFAVTPLYALGVTLAVSSRYKGPGKVGIGELREMSWLVLDPVIDTHSFVSMLFAEQGLEAPKRIIQCSSLAMYIELAGRLDVVSAWTDAGINALRKREEEGKMMRLQLDERMPTATMCMAYPAIDMMTATTREFVVWFQSTLRKSGSRVRFSVGSG